MNFGKCRPSLILGFSGRYKTGRKVLKCNQGKSFYFQFLRINRDALKLGINTLLSEI